jgi:DNA-binding CsgD family transcriptional regulator
MPVGELVATDESVTAAAVRHVQPKADRTGIALYRFRGDADRVASFFEEWDEVITSDITSVPNGVQVYSRFRQTGIRRRLLEITRDHAPVFDMPMTFTPRGGLRCRLIGEEPALQAATDALPDEVRAELVESGEYRPEGTSPAAALTPRQREVLRVAVESGYYEEPRRATAADVAERLDISRGTASEHLRKVESRVLSTVAD